MGVVEKLGCYSFDDIMIVFDVLVEVGGLLSLVFIDKIVVVNYFCCKE